MLTSGEASTEMSLEDRQPLTSLSDLSALSSDISGLDELSDLSELPDVSEISGLFTDVRVRAEDVARESVKLVPVDCPFVSDAPVGAVRMFRGGERQRLEIESMGAVELTTAGIVLSTHGDRSLTAWTEIVSAVRFTLTVANRDGAVTFVREHSTSAIASEMPGLVPPEGDWLM